MAKIEEQERPSTNEEWLIIVDGNDVPTMFEIAQSLGLASPVRVQPYAGSILHHGHVTPVRADKAAYNLTFPDTQTAEKFNRRLSFPSI